MRHPRLLPRDDRPDPLFAAPRETAPGQEVFIGFPSALGSRAIGAPRESSSPRGARLLEVGSAR